MKAESKVVSAYVPGLPTETASMPEPKQTAAPVAVEIKADASIAAEIKEAVVELPAPKVIVPKLTASEILKASVEPKITLLKDISFSFKLFPGYINSKDYVSFRAGRLFLVNNLDQFISSKYHHRHCLCEY